VPTRLTLHPFRQILLKIASRCNLACDYCYVYEHQDQSWRHRPRLMRDEILEVVTERIIEHAAAHQLRTVQVVFHGGEPLLAGPEYLDRAARLLRRVEVTGTRVELSVQTNGVLLTDDFLSVFHEWGIHVGVSLDGPASIHNLHRRRPNGRGSHLEVSRALKLLTAPEHRTLFKGLLGVIDLSADPVAYYQAMIENCPPAIDLLLPHGTWSFPPPGLDPDGAETPYASWLIEVFERWYGAPRRETGIRFFESIIMLLLGGETGSESVGISPIDLITVETDGAIEQVDSLKVAEDGAAATGLHVLTHSFDEALYHPGILARQQGKGLLSVECLRCPIVDICGGGLYTHRHRVGSGFGHPSVYCKDLYRLITHMCDRIKVDLDLLMPRSAASLRE
jgi:uncharacterized protein